MKISDIRIRLIEKEDSKLKAIASVTIDECFVVHDIKVIENKEEEKLFILMPSKKKPDGTYTDVAHPIKTETREELSALIIEAYNNALQNKE